MKAKSVSASRDKRGLRRVSGAEPQVVGLTPQTTQWKENRHHEEDLPTQKVHPCRAAKTAHKAGSSTPIQPRLTGLHRAGPQRGLPGRHATAIPTRWAGDVCVLTISFPSGEE